MALPRQPIGLVALPRKDDIADGLVGKMWGGSAGVMDESGTIRDEGTGEIVIKSSCLMSGYFNRPDLTAAAFIKAISGPATKD